MSLRPVKSPQTTKTQPQTGIDYIFVCMQVLPVDTRTLFIWFTMMMTVAIWAENVAIESKGHLDFSCLVKALVVREWFFCASRHGRLGGFRECSPRVGTPRGCTRHSSPLHSSTCCREVSCWCISCCCIFSGDLLFISTNRLWRHCALHGERIPQATESVRRWFCGCGLYWLPSEPSEWHMLHCAV